MNLESSGSHRFRCFTPAKPARVWLALTDGRQTRRYLHGLALDSAWTVDAPLAFRTGELTDGPAALVGGVLCIQLHRRLSYFLRSGPADPATYLTWELDPRAGGTVVHLQVDCAEHGDTEAEAEDTWLPVLAGLQDVLARDRDGRGDTAG